MPKRKTTEQFIADARKVHGDRYDYSKVVYKTSYEKVCIVCPEHGEFWQQAIFHTGAGYGCPSCSKRKKLTLTEYLAKAHKVHGDKYNYSKVEYVNDTTKICIICPEHGEFWQSAGNHTQGQGCPKCANKANGLRNRLPEEEFWKRCKEVHGDRYIYDKSHYTSNDNLITITCRIHGDFTQKAGGHMRGSGCPLCANLIAKPLISKEEFVERAKAVHTRIKYDYSKVVMTGMNNKVCITCPIHGDFWQTPANHLHGYGCTTCGYAYVSEKKTKSLELFIEQARAVHGDKYDYSEVVYKRAISKVAIRCKKHNMIFMQKPSAHLSGNGCPQCAQSHLEAEIMQFLIRNKFKFEAEKTFPWLKDNNHLYLDFFLPEYGVAIECQGIQHFRKSDFYGGEESFGKTKSRDRRKKKLCEEHGIVVLYYSNLRIKYPYEVTEDLNVLLQLIKSKGDRTNLSYSVQLEFDFGE